MAGILTNGAIIYHNDTLKVTFSINDGFELNTHTINGTTFQSEHIYTVVNSTIIISSTTRKNFVLSINQSTNSTIIVNRTSSPDGLSIGTLSNGDLIKYGDVLNIIFDISVKSY